MTGYSVDSLDSWLIIFFEHAPIGYLTRYAFALTGRRMGMDGITQGAATLALGYALLPFQGVSPTLSYGLLPLQGEMFFVFA